MSGFQHAGPLFVLRLVCALFFVPHIVGKFTAREASANFFKAAGFSPPTVFVNVAMLIETVLAVLLVLGIDTHVVGWIACAYLLTAAAAVVKVAKKWLWHIGGCEYPVMWAICCAVVAAASPG